MPGEKPLGAKERTNNNLNSNMASTLGFEPGPHWWEASALTTAPPLLPEVAISSCSTIHTCYSWSPQYSILGRLHKSRVFTLKIVFFLRWKVYKPHKCLFPQSYSPFTLLLQNFCLTTHRSLTNEKIWAILQSTPKVS